MNAGDPVVLSYHDCLLRESDVDLLEEPNWLNDQLIGFGFQFYEYDLFKNPDVAFITPDVCQFIKLSPVQELDVLLSSLDLNTKELIFLAVNDNASPSQAGGGHWSLLVYRKRTKQFEHYDSSGSSNRNSAQLLSRQLGKYLGKKAGFKNMSCPQQQNSYDCGMYVLCCAEFLCRGSGSNRPIHAEVNPGTVRTRRQEMRRIILDLAKK